MKGARRFVALVGIVALVLATLFGCSLLFKDAAGQSGWYIRLNIGNPAAGKAISVGEYEVTEVYIEVFAPEADQPFYAVSWYANDGSASYLIPVSEQGQYRIEVTHISGVGGDPVEATECANFNIRAMVITVIDIIPGCIGTIEVEPGVQDGLTAEEIYGCAMAAMKALWEAMAPLYQGSDEFPPGVTVDLSNFEEPGDEPPYGGIIIVTFTDYTPLGSDVTVNGDITIDVTFPPDLLGTFEEVISASLSVSCLPGETVDIDLTLSMFMEDAPYWQTLQWSGSITVDGQEADVDQVMTDWLAMVLEATTSADGTITVRVTGADDHNGAYFYYAVGTTGADLSDPSNWLGVAPTDPTIDGGTVKCITVDVGTDDPATFTGGESYDIFGLIDVDLDGDITQGVDYMTDPVRTVVVNGDTTLELVYPTEFVVVP